MQTNYAYNTPNIPCFNFSFLSQSCYDCSGSQSIYAMHMFSNWEDAVSRFSMFTSEDRLAKFTALNFKQSIPNPFRAYCQSALNLQTPSQESVKVTDEEVRVAAVCGPLIALSAEKLKEADPAYPGAQLILAKAPKVFNIMVVHDMT